MEADNRLATPLAGRALNVVSSVIVLAVWVLQGFHVRGGFVTNHGADLFGAMMVYMGLRQERRWPRLFRVFSPVGAAVFVFAGCTAFELAHISGPFDPFDVLNYGIGVLVCFCLDRWITPPARQKPRESVAIP
jgi:hypothetical protein